nr:unnamed protein product [Callosobruchus analis]CAI5832256.1 unnamed protein product [Callosobruchus analis]CAI5840625.1 unnamed protein product [Callosobruchus analis]CAI5847073.1 unnamed protein product [Callosobruchus analis]CAI5847077.1 unnamed protein product [Callosobruchus analis]
MEQMLCRVCMEDYKP